MPNDLTDIFIKQLEEILEKYKEIKLGRKLGDREETYGLITRATAAVDRISGNKSQYIKRIEEVLKFWGYGPGTKLQSVIGSVDALHQDLKAGYLKSLSELIHAELFSDFLEMAEHLLREGYKDAAAVIAGSTLEEHLRKLCMKNEIDVEIITSSGDLRPKKADQMNSDLARESIYSKLEQKQVTAWLDIRNNSAHAHYDEYNDEQVKILILGLRDFFKRYSV